MTKKLSDEFTYTRKKSTRVQIHAHLDNCASAFIPPLDQTVDIAIYADKLNSLAQTFEVWRQDTLVGLLAVYCNDPTRNVAFITNVSVLPAWTGRGIAAHMVGECTAFVIAKGFSRIRLEVNAANRSALALYERNGFTRTAMVDKTSSMVIMELPILTEGNHEH